MENVKETGKPYVLISVEPSEVNPGLSSIHINTQDPKDFMIAALLGIKALSEKNEIEYEKLLDLFIELLKNEAVIDHSLERIRKQDEDTLL